MKKIITFGNLTTNAIRKNTSNTVFNIGVCLEEAPTGNVTVSFSSALGKFTTSAALVFSTVNWATPQTLTITANNDGVTDVVLFDTLTLSASGGGYAGITKVLKVPVYDTVTWPTDLLFGYDEWINNAHATDAAATRQAAIDFMFNGNGLPVGHSNLSVTGSFSGIVHVFNTSALTHATRTDRYTITKLDDDGAIWTHYAFHIIATTGASSKLVILSVGNLTADTYDIDLAVNTFNAAGIDVLLIAGPASGVNTETSAVVTLTGSAGWNQMVSGGLDTPTYSPIELFFFDIAASLSYINANYAYTSIGITGIHAGAWIALVAGALFSDIDKVFPIRGLNPLPFDNVAGPFPLGDNLAVNGSKTYNFYLNTCSMVDYMIICAKQKFIKILDHTLDASSSSTTVRYWSELINEKFACSIDNYVSTAAGTATPAFYADFLTEIISEL